MILGVVLLVDKPCVLKMPAEQAKKKQEENYAIQELLF